MIDSRSQPVTLGNLQRTPPRISLAGGTGWVELRPGGCDNLNPGGARKIFQLPRLLALTIAGTATSFPLRLRLHSNAAHAAGALCGLTVLIDRDIVIPISHR